MEQSFPSEHKLPALYMVWRPQANKNPFLSHISHLYELRSYKPGQERLLGELIRSEGWPFDTTHWQDYQDHIVPNGLFLVWHRPSDALVGTAGAIHNPRGSRYYFPFGGQLADLVVHPDHRRQGLGTFLITQVVHRLQSAGYSLIWTGVQGFRLAAIRRYIALGFEPFLYEPSLIARWQRIYDQLGYSFSSEQYVRAGASD